MSNGSAHRSGSWKEHNQTEDTGNYGENVCEWDSQHIQVFLSCITTQKRVIQVEGAFENERKKNDSTSGCQPGSLAT